MFGHKTVSDDHMRYDRPLSGQESGVHSCAAETDTGDIGAMVTLFAAVGW